MYKYMEKVCCTCQIPKTLDCFNHNKNQKDGKQRYCRDCTRERDRKYALNNRDKILEMRREINKRYYDFFRDLKKNQKCSKCNDDRWFVLDYHHKDGGEKIKDVSLLKAQGGKKKTLAEIEKCVLLCSNCHREFHFLERESGINLVQYLEE